MSVDREPASTLNHRRPTVFFFFFKPKRTLTAIRLNIVELFVTGIPVYIRLIRSK
jgi:hypothetical protein